MPCSPWELKASATVSAMLDGTWIELIGNALSTKTCVHSDLDALYKVVFAREISVGDNTWPSARRTELCAIACR